MTNTMIYICIAMNDSGIIDIELLDQMLSASFLEGYRDAGLRFEIRAGYINGGDSSIEMKG